MHERLVAVLKGIIELLAACNHRSWADWFRRRLESLQASTIARDRYRATLEEIRGVIAGMGSFTDLSLIPSPGSGLTDGRAREFQWAFADELDKVIEALLAR